MSFEKNAIPDAALKELQLRYQESIPEKVNNLRQLINQFQNLQDLDTLNSLRNAVHKIAGSAGTYGFSEVSKICKEFEGNLIQKIKNFSSRAQNSAWLAECENYVKKIQEGFIDGNPERKK